MKKFCDSKVLCCDCKHQQLMTVAVNFNGKLRSYCSLKCAEDDIGECSNGADNLIRAAVEYDIFIISVNPRKDIDRHTRPANLPQNAAELQELAELNDWG